MLGLPPLPEEQRRKGKNDEQDQTLGIHEPVRSKGAIASCSGNRIVSARMIRVTPCEAARGEPYAPRRPMAPDRLARIVGATREKTAVRAHQWTDRILITPQHEQQQCFHQWRVSVSVPSSSDASRNKPESVAGEHAVRNRNTMSNASSAGRRSRMASRRSRLT